MSDHELEIALLKNEITEIDTIIGIGDYTNTAVEGLRGVCKDIQRRIDLLEAPDEYRSIKVSFMKEYFERDGKKVERMIVWHRDHDTGADYVADILESEKGNTEWFAKHMRNEVRSLYAKKVRR